MTVASEQVLDVKLPRVSKPISVLAVGGLLRGLDVLIIVLVGYLSYLGVAQFRPVPLFDDFLGPIVLGALVALFSFNHFGLYNQQSLLTDLLKVHRLLLAWIVTAGVLLLLAFAFKITASYSRIWAFSWISLTFFALLGCRVVFHAQIKRLAEKGRFANRTVVVGTGEQGRRLAANIQKYGWPYTQMLGFVDDRISRVPDEVDGHLVLGGTSELIGLIQKGLVDDVILALPWSAERRLKGLIGKLSTTAVHIRLGPDLVGFNFPDRGTTTIARVPVLGVFERPISGWSHVAKRAEDILLSLVLLTFLGPLMLAIAALVKLDSRGPALFRQQRYGFNNTVIEVLKFRTMRVDCSGSDGSIHATRNDPRVTRTGRFLRKTSLDELPQLLNVLFGDMSLVGPRPHAVGHNPEGRRFEELVERYAARHRVKPGITGWAQVNGWRGELDTVEKIRNRVEHDLYYIDNWSVWFDIVILLKTLMVVWTDKNAY